MMYSVKDAEIAQAKQVCAKCPVREPCLQFALDHKEVYGIWGGYDERQLRLLYSGRGLDDAIGSTRSGRSALAAIGYRAARPR